MSVDHVEETIVLERPFSTMVLAAVLFLHLPTAEACSLFGPQPMELSATDTGDTTPPSKPVVRGVHIRRGRSGESSCDDLGWVTIELESTDDTTPPGPAHLSRSANTPGAQPPRPLPGAALRAARWPARPTGSSSPSAGRPLHPGAPVSTAPPTATREVADTGPTVASEVEVHGKDLVFVGACASSPPDHGRTPFLLEDSTD